MSDAQPLRDDLTILVCRLAGEQVTSIHDSLWPQLVDWRIAAVSKEHTSSGVHQLIEIPFSDWVLTTATDMTAGHSR